MRQKVANDPTHRHFGAWRCRLPLLDKGDPRTVSDSAPETALLRVLATSDLHANMWSYDYLADRIDTTVGLARLTGEIAQARAEVGAGNCLLVDNGDTLQGSALADWAAATRAADGPHPVAAALNALKYDAATFGNHDFNYGLDLVRRWLDDLDHRVVCANLVYRNGPPLTPRSVLLTRRIKTSGGTTRRVCVGVTGALPPQTLAWDGVHLAETMRVRDIREALAEEIAHLQALGADVVVALAHTGIGVPDAARGAEDCALAVSRLPVLDAIVAGHSHKALPGADFAPADGLDSPNGRLNGVPAVMPGAYGSHLGQIDLSLRFSDGAWSVSGGTARLRTPAHPCATGKDVVSRSTLRAHKATRADASRQVGETRTVLHSAFPFVVPSPALQFCAEAHVARARALLGRDHAGNDHLISAVAPFRYGGRAGPDGYTLIAPGPVTNRHLLDLAPFPNRLCILEMDGDVLRDWVERSVAIYTTLRPGEAGAPLTRDGLAGYTFDIFFGLKYTIDLSKSGLFGSDGARVPDRGRGATRVCDLRTFDDTPVDPHRRYRVVTTDYRAAAVAGFAMLRRAERLVVYHQPVREALRDHLATGGPVTIEPVEVWSFADIGASASFTGPPQAKAAWLGPLQERVTAVGQTADGFSQWSLTLRATAAMHPEGDAARL